MTNQKNTKRIFHFKLKTGLNAKNWFLTMSSLVKLVSKFKNWEPRRGDGKRDALWPCDCTWKKQGEQCWEQISFAIVMFCATLRETSLGLPVPTVAQIELHRPVWMWIDQIPRLRSAEVGQAEFRFHKKRGTKRFFFFGFPRPSPEGAFVISPLLRISAFCCDRQQIHCWNSSWWRNLFSFHCGSVVQLEVPRETCLKVVC